MRQTNFPEAGGNTRPKLLNRSTFLLRGAAEDLPYLFFHTAPVALRAPLNPPLDVIFELTHDKLSHRQNDITISKPPMKAEPEHAAAVKFGKRASEDFAWTSVDPLEVTELRFECERALAMVASPLRFAKVWQRALCP
jgi:hypothetical protein